MAQFKEYIKADSLAQVLQLLKELEETAVIAGGTDLLLKLGSGAFSDKTLIDISGLEEISSITSTNTGLYLGSATKLTTIETSKSITGSLSVIKEASAMIGSPQIRNLATIGGNICNASPSGDLSAPLIAVNASVEITSATSQREVPIEDFFIGPSKTILNTGELLTAIHIPNPKIHSSSVYLKHSYRKAMDLAIVGVCVYMWREHNKLESRLALSAVAPTPIRVVEVENLISGKSKLTQKLLENAASTAVKATNPLSDVRASKAYREAMTFELVQRALSEAYKQLS